MVSLQQTLTDDHHNLCRCYCTMKISSIGNDEQHRSVIQCGQCETYFHLQCVNKRLLIKEEAFTCLDCKVSSQLVNKEQIYQFNEEIKHFYSQYESNYQSFESSLALLITRQVTYNDKYLKGNKHNLNMLQQEFDQLRNKAMLV